MIINFHIFTKNNIYINRNEKISGGNIRQKFRRKRSKIDIDRRFRVTYNWDTKDIWNRRERRRINKMDIFYRESWKWEGGGIYERE